MKERDSNALTKILAFASVVEIATGLALMVNPALVVRLLLGEEAAGIAVLLGRCFGAALFALGVSCWPDGQRADSGTAAFRAMLIYNGLIAAYLARLGVVGQFGGLLLWPAVLLHGVVAALLVWTLLGELRLRAGTK